MKHGPVNSKNKNKDKAQAQKEPPLCSASAAHDSVENKQSSSSQPQDKSTTLEHAVKNHIIPTIYGHYGPGMISRRKNPKSLIQKEFSAYLNEYTPTHEIDWFTNPGDLGALITKLQRQDHEGALHVLQEISERGGSFDDICLGIIDAVGKTLNCRWQEDDMNFIEVSIISSCLKQVMRKFARDQQINLIPTSNQKSAFITALPDDGHTLGAQIIEEMIRRAGWTVFSGINEDTHAISVKVRKKEFTLIGISISNFTSIKRCKALIDDLRSQSLNPNVIIMIGGYAVTNYRDACEEIGADVLAHDAKHALSVIARIEKAMDLNNNIGDGQVRLNPIWMNASRDHKNAGLNNR